MIVTPFANYDSGNSVLHRLDPRVKLVGVTVGFSAALLAGQWDGLIPIMGLALITNIAGKSSLHRVGCDIISLWIFYVITLALHSFLSKGEPLIHLPLGIMITTQGIERGIFFSIKIMLLATLAGPVMRSTHPAEWGIAVEGLAPDSGRWNRSLKRFALTLGLAVSFLPMLLNEADRIRMAQISRGLEPGGGLIRRIKNLLPLVMPLVASSLHKTDLITMAMQSRGFQLDKQRSNYRPLRLHFIDLIAITIVALIVAYYLLT